jgi:hypothetical protein
MMGYGRCYIVTVESGENESRDEWHIVTRKRVMSHKRKASGPTSGRK